jgi:hypothetical protein
MTGSEIRSLPIWLRSITVVLLTTAGACGQPGSDDGASDSSDRVLTVAETPTRARAADGSYISWREHLIDDEALGGVAIRGADGLKMADLDGDGFEDIVSVHEDSNHIRLAFGSDDPDHWQLATLAEGDEAGAVEDIAIADVNGDGLLDLLVACELAHLIYFQNPGARDVRLGTWPRVIPAPTVDSGSWIRVYLDDLNGDGRLEAVATNKGDQNPQPQSGPRPMEFPTDWPLTPIALFEIDGDPLLAESWVQRDLTRVQMPVNSRPVDLDGDGDLDILGGSRPEARVFWLENLLEESDGEFRFREHPIEVTNRSVPQKAWPRHLTGMSVDFADLNHDGRLDIVLQETSELNVWLEQPPEIDDAWFIHPIGDIAPDHPTGVTLVDLDDDGDLDLVTGGYSDPPRDRDNEDATAASIAGRLAWFENSGDPTASWRRHDISRRVRGMYDEIVPRDMDGDGDIDLVATRGNSGTFDGVFWLEQVRSEEPKRAFEPARLEESRPLPLPPV